MSEEARDDAAAGGRVDRLAAETLNDARQLTEGTAQKLIDAIEHSAPGRHLRGSQVATGVLGTVGFALFIVGVMMVFVAAVVYELLPEERPGKR